MRGAPNSFDRRAKTKITPPPLTCDLPLPEGQMKAPPEGNYDTGTITPWSAPGRHPFPRVFYYLLVGELPLLGVHLLFSFLFAGGCVPSRIRPLLNDVSLKAEALLNYPPRRAEGFPPQHLVLTSMKP